MLRLQRDPTYTGLNKFLVNHCWFDWVGVGERAWNLWISCILWTLLSLKKPRQLLNPKWRTNPPPQNCRRCKRKRNWAKSQTRSARGSHYNPSGYSCGCPAGHCHVYSMEKIKGLWRQVKMSPLDLDPTFESMSGLITKELCHDCLFGLAWLSLLYMLSTFLWYYCLCFERWL